jgi:hypothetical protein
MLTRTLAANALEGPLTASVFRATSAAACSACLRVEQKVGLSKVSPLKFTVALNRGAWSGPSRMHEYDGRLKQLLWANSCNWFLYMSACIWNFIHRLKGHPNFRSFYRVRDLLKTTLRYIIQEVFQLKLGNFYRKKFKTFLKKFPKQ